MRAWGIGRHFVCLPAIIALVAAAAAPFVWVLWNWPPPSTVRAVYGKGVVLVNWGPPSNARVKWNLGTGLRTERGPVQFFAMWLNKPEMDWDIEVHQGHVKIPVLYGAAVLAGVPFLFRTWKRLRTKPAWACGTCGYDLRGGGGKACPECGAPRTTA